MTLERNAVVEPIHVPVWAWGVVLLALAVIYALAMEGGAGRDRLRGGRGRDGAGRAVQPRGAAGGRHDRRGALRGVPRSGGGCRAGRRAAPHGWPGRLAPGGRAGRGGVRRAVARAGA